MLAVNCAPIYFYSEDDRETPAETASNEMVMWAMQSLSEFSLLVSHQNHSDVCLTALDDALKPANQKKGIFQEHKMSKSVNVKVDHLLPSESHQLRGQKIHKLHAAMKALVYGAETVSTTGSTQSQVHLNRVQQTATHGSDVDCQKAIEQLEREIHQLTLLKC